MHTDSVDRPGWYEITIQGLLDARWSTLFDGMALTTRPGGITVLRGPVRDQASLHGLLSRVRDLGMPLLSVDSIAAPPEGDAEPATP